MVDYKISRITDEENGRLTVVVRYYEGAVTTEPEYNPETDSTEDINRYRRTSVLEEVTYDLEDISQIPNA